jgi:4-hydroxybenzoate polyprenyltransferase
MSLPPDPSLTSFALPDSVRLHWVERYAPAATRPYLRLARLDRPIGWWLLLLPCWWSLGLASSTTGRPLSSGLTALFMIGAIAMRGAGSTFNDIVDRKLDAQVERTRMRPLPSGQVTPRQAALFMLLQCAIGLAVLLQFNNFTILLAMGSLVIVAIYPFMKRITDMPQLVLGLAFSWGALVGWSAVTGSLAMVPVLVYAAAIVWTIGYDTIYALQDIADDSIIGIKSSARLFARKTRLAVAILFAASFALLVLALWRAQSGLAAWCGLVAFGLHLGWQIMSLANRSPENALRLFRSNEQAGLLLAAGILLDAALRAELGW